MKIKGKLMDADGMGNTFRRLAHQVVELGGGAEDLVLIGIRTRGVTVAKRIKACIDAIEGTDVPLGVFDIALDDDVLYTGRTVRAAIAEVMQLGRPARIRFLALIDRGHRELPFRADFVGKSVPTSRREGISVRFAEDDGEDGVYIYEK